MSRHSKKNLDVIGPIQAIAANAMSQIGFFHNGINLSTTKLQRDYKNKLHRLFGQN